MSDITYVVDRVRVKVKAIGALTAADVHAVHKHDPTETPSSERVLQDNNTADMSKVYMLVRI